MISKKDIERIIDECRSTGAQGLGNGVKATIQDIYVDFLIPPFDFLGLNSNPAVFINAHTHALLGKAHPSWQINQTIAVKEGFLEKQTMMIIGILVHEAGHAFNVAAGIPNSELNAYIFEIEIIAAWFKKQSPLLFNCSKEDLQSFFETRLPCYRLETKRNPYLAMLVKKIEEKSLFEPPSAVLKLLKIQSPRFFMLASPKRNQPAGRIFEFELSQASAGCEKGLVVDP